MSLSTDTPAGNPNAAPVRKFMFERSFDSASIVHRAQERKPVLLKPEQVDAMKKESHDAGFAAGVVAGKEEQIAQQTAVLGRIEHTMTMLVQSIGALAQEQEEQTRQLALAIAKKILPTFTAQSGTQEIEALINDTLRSMAREPRLVVRVGEADFEVLNSRIQEIATQRAYPGKVVVLADNEVVAGDCRIEWADGGVGRDTPATMAAIEQTILPSS